MKRSEKVMADQEQDLMERTAMEFEIVQARLREEIQALPNSDRPWLSQLNIDQYTPAIGDSVHHLIAELETYYSDQFNLVYDFSESKKAEHMEAAGGKSIMLKQRDAYHNDYLTDLVRNGFSKHKIACDNGALVAIADPIYRTPKASLLNFRTHFFAPEKPLFNTTFGTFGFNIAMLWTMTLLLYLTLYFKLFERLLERTANVVPKRNNHHPKPSNAPNAGQREASDSENA